MLKNSLRFCLYAISLLVVVCTIVFSVWVFSENSLLAVEKYDSKTLDRYGKFTEYSNSFIDMYCTDGIKKDDLLCKLTQDYSLVCYDGLKFKVKLNEFKLSETRFVETDEVLYCYVDYDCKLESDELVTFTWCFEYKGDSLNDIYMV